MEKATIRNLDTNDEIRCLFNPSEYTVERSNTFTPHPVRGGNVPRLEFGGGSSMTLTMQLFLDTSLTGGDVRATSNRVRALMDVDENARDDSTARGRPPIVEFRWGTTWSFRAVISRMTETCTLFRENGTPVRATLNVTFLQAREVAGYPAQNPTTMGTSGYKHWIVREGDTIDWIAFREYGDATMWRRIADVNNLDDPGRMRPGMALAIPPAP
jgi:hypothetical protein